MKNDGGPAFPAHTWIDENRTAPMGGMPLRDYFAGQVLCASITWGSPGDIARRAYDIADAMIAARATQERT